MIPAKAKTFLASAGPLLALVVLFIAFRLAIGPSFWGFLNLQNLLTQTAIVATGAIGMTLIIVSGGIDLSCGACVALAAVMAARVLSPVSELAPDASAMQHWWHALAMLPDWSAIPVAIILGAAIGLINGSLITGLRQMPFITTLGMMGIARGLAKWQSDEQPVNFEADWLTGVMASPPRPAAGASIISYLKTAPSIWIVIGLVALMSVVMRLTVFGRHIYAIGSNEAAARLCGIRIIWTKLAIYTLAGAFFGLAGVFSAARLTQGDPTTALGLELDIIAAVVVGGASLSGGTGTVIGSIVGALLMAVLRNGSNQIGWPPYSQEILIGVAITVAVALDRLRTRRG